MSESQIAEVLGRVPSGLFILTVRHDGEETGVLTSWVMQAGFDPPMLTLALKRGRFVGEWLEAGASFVLNLVGVSDKALLKHFGRGFDRGQPALAGRETFETASGQPALTEAVGYLECRPLRHIDSNDHRIFLAEIVGGRVVANGEPYVHVRTNGLKY